MQLLSESPTSRTIDSEIGDLMGEYISHKPMFGYLRYNVDLESEALSKILNRQVDRAEVKSLQSIDRAELVSTYAEIGRSASMMAVDPKHF